MKRVVGQTNTYYDGTYYYRLKLDDVIDYFDEQEDIIMAEIFRQFGFSCLDIDSMFGSHISDDVLYVCVTDGEPIEIDGEYVDPEDAIDAFGIKSIKNYVEDGTDEIIHRHITPYEILNVDLKGIVIKLLNTGYSVDYVFSQLKHDGFLTND